MPYRAYAWTSSSFLRWPTYILPPFQYPFLPTYLFGPELYLTSKDHTVCTCLPGLNPKVQAVTLLVRLCEVSLAVAATLGTLGVSHYLGEIRLVAVQQPGGPERPPGDLYAGS